MSPLADTGSEVPKIPLGGAGIVRCRRCRAYINPFMQWSDGGRCAAISGNAHLRRKCLMPLLADNVMTTSCVATIVLYDICFATQGQNGVASLDQVRP